MNERYVALVQGLREYFGVHGFQKAVIGLSGGIDSALTLKVAVDALKAKNVVAIHMPEFGVTDRLNTEHAKQLAEFMGVEFIKVPINRFLEPFDHLRQWNRGGTAEMNAKARVRMMLLYDYANSFEALVLGTSNKSELMLGYGTKFGDLAADVEVIGALYKTDVYRIADELGLPKELLEKPPSAELFKGQTDADELGASYGVLDEILIAIEKGYETEKFDQHLVRSVKDRIKLNKHKIAMPPTLAF